MMTDPTVVNITIELGTLHVLIGISTLAVVLALHAINKRLVVIGIALKGIELQGSGILSSAVQIHKAILLAKSDD